MEDNCSGGSVEEKENANTEIQEHKKKVRIILFYYMYTSYLPLNVHDLNLVMFADDINVLITATYGDALQKNC